MPDSIVQASPGGISPGQGHIIATLTPVSIEDTHLHQDLLQDLQQGLHKVHHHLGEGESTDTADEVQEQCWVKGAGEDDNARYRKVLQYMEDRRSEAKARLQEDQERREKAKKREESFALLRTSTKYLKEKEDDWRCRRIVECTRIKEEEKKDRLAFIKEKKKRYGLKRLSKEENSRITLRTEERLDIARGKTNLWRKFGLGRKGNENEELDEEECKAWEEVQRLVLELEEEEGSWRDNSIKIKDIVIRKPRIELKVVGGDVDKNQAAVLVSKEERPCKQLLGDSQEAEKRESGENAVSEWRTEKDDRRKEWGQLDRSKGDRCAPTPNCFMRERKREREKAETRRLQSESGGLTRMTRGRSGVSLTSQRGTGVHPHLTV